MPKNVRPGSLDFLVGVDPGMKGRCGFSIYDVRKRKLKVVESTTVWEFLYMMKVVERVNLLGRVGIVVENPNMDSAIFNQGKMSNSQFFNQEKSRMGFERALGSVCKKASNIGQNRGAANVVIDELRRSGYVVLEIAPSERDKVPDAQRKSGDLRRYKMPTKSGKEQFNKMTGFVGMSNEHGRDGAMLVYGMDEQNFIYRMTVQNARAEAEERRRKLESEARKKMKEKQKA